MPGLFSIFNTAKSGLFAQQTAINVTSHNIANANTDGYSRQRADMVTTTPYTLPSIDSAAGAGQLGTGVTVKSIERIRDSFLDYQIRVENGGQGQYKARDKYLSQVENILGADIESSGSGISSLIQNFFNAWQSLSSSSQNASTVKEEACQLTNELNHTYSQVSDIKTNTNTEIKGVVVNVNSILGRISDLNQQIRDTKVAGQNPNDLLDSRDLLLDQLSSEFGINITDNADDAIDVTTSNSASVDGDNGSAPLIETASGTKPLNIVQTDNPKDTNVATFSYVTSITATTDSNGGVAKDSNGNTIYKVDYYKKGDDLTDANKVTIYVGMTSAQEKELDENRVLWADNTGTAYKVKPGTDASGKSTEVVDGTLSSGTTVDFSQLALFKPPTGELKGYTSVQKNIDGYQDTLNKFAKSLALSVNAIISQSSTWVKDNPTDGSAEGGINNFFVNADQKDASKYSVADENNITAANITVNVAIINDPSKIKVDTKYDSNGKSLSTNTDGNRAVAVAQLANSLMNISSLNTDIDTSDGASDNRCDRNDLLKDIFTSNDKLNNVYSVGKVNGGATLDNYFNDLVNTVASNEQEAKQSVDRVAVQIQSYTQSKESTSGVSIDEEMTNLIQYQHCYQANAKMISTVDELLDVVINQLKR